MTGAVVFVVLRNHMYHAAVVQRFDFCYRIIAGVGYYLAEDINGLALVVCKNLPAVACARGIA